jgi:hypothetical protein
VHLRDEISPLGGGMMRLIHIPDRKEIYRDEVEAHEPGGSLYSEAPLMNCEKEELSCK